MAGNDLNKYFEKNDYFKFRGITPESYNNYRFPKYLEKVFPKDKSAKILDIGCGFGQFLSKLKEMGYTNVKGIDTSSESCKFCTETGLNVEKIEDIPSYCNSTSDKFDFILMSHVIEHIEKEEIIENISAIQKNLLKKGGQFCVVTPNAQSNTGSYWYFEDFTHKTSFTSGSLLYVLRAAGFKKITFIDKRGTDGFGPFVKLIRNTFYPIYYLNKLFWNRVTSSGYHISSPIIFTGGIKAIAEN